jgi:IS5 family transposase
MNDLMPWDQLEAVIELFYPKTSNGRRPYPLLTMFRIHCMQHWYSMSDPAMEDALYEITSMRLFSGLSLDSPIPDHTTIMNFRHLLEKHKLSRQFFKEVNKWLSSAGIYLKEGTIVDATIIEAASSTKNKAKVEHPFRIIKCQFGFRKAIYRGLAKNDNKLAMLFALANVCRIDQMMRAARD